MVIRGMVYYCYTNISIVISRTGCWKYEYNYTSEQVNREIYLTLLHSQLSLLVGFFARQDRDTSQDSKKHFIYIMCMS